MWEEDQDLAGPPEEEEQTGVPRPGVLVCGQPEGTLRALDRKPSPPGPTLDVPDQHMSLPCQERGYPGLMQEQETQVIGYQNQGIEGPAISHAISGQQKVSPSWQWPNNFDGPGDRTLGGFGTQCQRIAPAGGPEGTDHPNICVSVTLECRGSSAASGQAAVVASSTTACIHCWQTTCSSSSYSSCHYGLAIAGHCPTFQPGIWHLPASPDDSANPISYGSGAAALSCTKTSKRTPHPLIPYLQRIRK